MAKATLSKKVKGQIKRAVASYTNDMLDYDALTTRVIDHFTKVDKFKKLIHSSKSRTKVPDHLRDKLIRKAEKAKQEGETFNISEHLDDLAGVRFLHIHTKQIELIHPLILEILDKFGYQLVKEPVAYTWDIENKTLFERVGFDTHFREDMYTSVHYIVKPHYSDFHCEIQVRTLMEELWGEVSHTINYPTETKSKACREQLRVLARIASGCTRLVDSIFVSYTEHQKTKHKKKKKSKKKIAKK